MPPKENKTLQQLQEEFIREYCVKRLSQPIRWIRSIFWDDAEQIETILNYIAQSYQIGLTQSRQSPLDKIESMITKEILICHEEDTPTSRLTSLAMKIK